MIVPGNIAPLRPVFISFSSKDLKLATTICQAIESRGAACWISNRDVKGGENFQEAIISAINGAKIMVLVFSSNTNNSGEIKKELAIASQKGLVVIPVRVEDVLPSGAFAYELSTRQWVDLFRDWENAMEGLTGRIASVLGTSDAVPVQEKQEPPREEPPKADPFKTDDKEAPKTRLPLIGGALAACIALSAGGFYYYQHVAPTPPPAALTADRLQTERPDAPAHKIMEATSQSAGQLSGDLKQGSAFNIAARETSPSQKGSDLGKTIPARATEADSSNPRQRAEENSAAAYNLASQDTKAASDTVVASREPQDGGQSMPQDDQAERKREPRALAAPVGPPPKIADAGLGGQVFRECANCPAMVVIPAGSNWVGSTSSQSGHDSSEEPRRQVQFKQPFAIGRDAVTYAEWDACVAEGGCNHFLPGDMGWGRGQQPVVLVSWEDAKAYTNWLSQKTGATYRLPFEAEWEYAARACLLAICQDQIFWFGNRINPDRANYDWRYSYAGSQKAQALGKPKPAGTDGPNAFGLFNAVGNVAQWVEDCWNENLKTLPADGSARLTGDCSSRVFRGGSWHDEPVDLRSASRKSDLSNSRQPFIGFRVARVLTE